MPGAAKPTRRRRTELLVAAAAMLTGACEHPRAIELGKATPVSTATGVGTAPMFAVSPAGARAVAWVSAPGGGTDGRLYLSVNGSEPIEIRDPLGPIAAHGESPPELAYGPDGALNALYVVGKVRPDRRFPLGALRFVRSTDGGAHWTAPATVTDDSVFGSHNFHALHAGADGTLYASWLDGRAGRSGAYLASSTDGGTTWSANQRVAPGEACPCCRTAIATAADGTLYLAWRKVSADSVRDIVVARSADHGKSWSAPRTVHDDNWVFNACPHAGPSLAVDSAGTLHVAWWTGRDGIAGVYYAQSRDGAQTFSEPVPLQAPALARPAHVQLATAGHGRILVAWDDGSGAAPLIKLKVSSDNGRSFGSAIPLSDPGQAAGFPVLAVTGDSVAIAWSEENPDEAARQAAARPDMSDPHSSMGLEPVGQASVMVRLGVLAPVASGSGGQ